MTVRTFAQNPKANQQTTPVRFTGRTHIGHSRRASSIFDVGRTIGDQTGATRGNSNGSASRSGATHLVASHGRGHDFSRVHVVHAWVATEDAATRSVDGGASEEEDVTQAPAAPGVTESGPAPAAPDGQCHVESGPTYTPSGNVPVTDSGGRKRATFTMAAAFGTAFVTDPPRLPRCCEVRQYIKWDEAYQKSKGGPPHSGFPSSATANTWYEDRDTNDKRYGHRSGVHSDPIAGCGDEYLTGGTRDQANGDTYCGRDSPNAPSARTGTFNFQLKVIDTCNGNAEKASSSVITVKWG